MWFLRDNINSNVETEELFKHANVLSVNFRVYDYDRGEIRGLDEINNILSFDAHYNTWVMLQIRLSSNDM